MSGKRLVLAALLVISALVNITLPVSASTFPGQNGRLFVGVGSMNPDILSFAPDGSDGQIVVDGNIDVNISADGKKIVYSDQDADTLECRLVVANADGSSPQYIPTDPFGVCAYSLFNNSGLPALSPDGQTIYFVGAAGFTRGLYSVSVHGTDFTTIALFDGVQFAANLAPLRLNVSPDGTKIAFTPSNNTSAVMIIDTAGNLLDTIAVAGYYISPAWSPDGQYFPCMEVPDVFQPPTALCRISSSGGAPVNYPISMPSGMPDTPLSSGAIVYSPDGQKLAFHIHANPSALYIADLSANTVALVADDLPMPSVSGYAPFLAWQPIVISPPGGGGSSGPGPSEDSPELAETGITLSPAIVAGVFIMLAGGALVPYRKIAVR